MAPPTVPRVEENEDSKTCVISGGSGLPSMVGAIPVLYFAQTNIQ